MIISKIIKMVKPIKIIWSYWDGPQDNLIKKCFHSWFEYLDDWDINILDEKSLESLNILKPSTWSELSPTTKSDIIRLNVLYKYGGIWMDASILLHQNFDWLTKYLKVWSKNNYFQFRIPLKIWEESSFLVVPQKYNKSIEKWRDLLLEVIEFWPEVEKSPIYKIKYTHNSKYFMIYQTHLYLLKNDISFKRAKILPIFGTYTLFPFILPKFLELRYFTKFIKGTRKIWVYQTHIIVTILILIICGLSYFFYTK